MAFPSGRPPVHHDGIHEARSQRPDQPPGRSMAEVVTGRLDLALRIWDEDHARAKSEIKAASAMLHGGIDAWHVREMRPGPAGYGLMPWQVRKVQAFIDASLDEKIRARDCARQTRLSVSHFSRAFKATFEMTVLGYIHRCRVERAKRLMRVSGESLSAIAFSCGFSDQAHFCRVFRSVVGTSPNRWRRQVLPVAPDDRDRSDDVVSGHPPGRLGWDMASATRHNPRALRHVPGTSCERVRGGYPETTDLNPPSSV